MRTLPGLRGTLAVACLAAAAPAGADAVTDWNQITSDAINTTIDFAVVQGAVHDAVQAFTGRYEPYVAHIPGASGSPVAAVARAAHDVLVNRLPAQTAALDATYASYLAAHGLAATMRATRARVSGYSASRAR